MRLIELNWEEYTWGWRKHWWHRPFRLATTFYEVENYVADRHRRSQKTFWLVLLCRLQLKVLISELYHARKANCQSNGEIENGGHGTTNEIPYSHVRWTGLIFHMWNLGVRNKYFTYEMEHSHTKINVTYEIFISHMELKPFTYEIKFSYVKLDVKFL